MFLSDLGIYFTGRLGEVLGIGFIGLAVPILFRRSLLLSLASGVIAVCALAALNIYMGHAGGRVEDHAILLGLAALIGAGAGWFWNAGYGR